MEEAIGATQASSPQRVAHYHAKSKSVESVTAIKIMQRLEQNGYCCELTGWKIDPKTAAMDHKTPISSGGLHVMSNIAIVHEKVNKAKGTMTTNEFIEMCVAVANTCRNVDGSL